MRSSVLRVLLYAVALSANTANTVLAAVGGDTAATTTTDFHQIVSQGATTAPVVGERPLVPPGAQVKAPAGPVVPWDDEKLDAHFFPPGTRELSRETSLSLVFNGFRRSSIDPCGCVSHVLGGLDREARLYERLKVAGQPVLKVDAGGFVRDLPYDAHRTRSVFMLEAMKELEFDVVNVAFPDASAGIAFLQDLQTSYSIPFVSANLVDETSAPVFAPYRVVPVELKDGTKVRVGFIGVTRSKEPGNPEIIFAPGSPPEKPGKKYAIADRVEALKTYLPKVKAQSDIVVLLAFEFRPSVVKLLQELGDAASQIDLAIAGDWQGLFRDIVEFNGVKIVAGGFEGRQVGHLMVDLAGKKVNAAALQMIEIEQGIPPVPAITKYLDKAKTTLLSPAAAPQAPVSVPIAPAAVETTLNPGGPAFGAKRQ